MATSARSPGDPGQNPARGAGAKNQGRVERLRAAIRVLELERKIRKADLLELAGVGSQSSFKRLKSELASAGLPLTYNRDDGHYHVPPEASFARYGIDTRTRARLAQVRATVAGIGGIAQEALEEVLAVLEARVAFDDPEAVPVVTSRHPQPRGGTGFYAALDRALSAVREHRWLSFVYARTAGGEPTPRTIAPYAVHEHDGRYYVWGTLEGDASPFPAPRMFALDRMREVALEPDTFVPDTSLDLGDALRNSFGAMVSPDPPHEVVVRIAPEAAAFVACRIWPAERVSAEEDDGGLRMTFEVTSDDELIAWVLSFGGAATIVSPPRAGAELRRRAQRILAAGEPQARDILALRPFVPARDFERSIEFYSDLGFGVERLDAGLASLQLGPFAFLLQAYDVPEFARHFMLQMLVKDLTVWWTRIEALDLAARYGVRAPLAPAVQPWGLKVAFVFDPTGVLWHVVEDRSAP
jgi:predicted DNA-binding transcriptional regulator YafY